MVLFWPLAAATSEEGYYSDSFARLSFVKGEVYVERANELGTEEGVVNLALVEGDKLVTRLGRAEVHFGKKNYLRLDNHTEVEFSAMPREGDNRVRLHLFAGCVYLRVSYLREEKSFEIHTPDASFYVLEEGLYRLDMKAGQETTLSVVEGSMEAAGETGSQLVNSRESLAASSGQLGTQAVLSSKRDDFDSWNRDRDSLLRQYASRRYLPAELDEYEGELESHGYWVYERPYGYVWVPYVIYTDWRPYYYGRWVWYPICGWTWVAYEPWGWCVYHYGRWHWRFGLGWYWIPTRYWGPAWVHWYWGYDYVGWCPLSWYNRPVVIVNNYFYDRYHHSYYPANSRALTVVHRNQLQSPDVSRVALSHVEASRLGQITLQARQPDIKPTVTRAALNRTPEVRGLSSPQVRPSRNSLAPSAGQSSVRSSSRISREGGRLDTPAGRSDSGLKVFDRNISRSRALSGDTSPGRESSRAPSSSSSVSSAPRRIQSDAPARRVPSLSSLPARTKSYSSSPSTSSRASSPNRRTSSWLREAPRIYQPDSAITRPKSSSSSYALPRRSEDISRSFSSSVNRQNYAVRNPSVSAPRSVFSTRRSFSSLPSVSSPRNSFQSFSSSSRSFSPPSSFAPSRSSSAPSSGRSVSGRVVRKNN